MDAEGEVGDAAITQKRAKPSDYRAHTPVILLHRACSSLLARRKRLTQPRCTVRQGRWKAAGPIECARKGNIQIVSSRVICSRFIIVDFVDIDGFTLQQ